ncbi:MAG: alpha/beta hydrolase [Tepidiforma sp.]|nr:alpha/beta fold hydrolase [Tepidiforma sp.]GIW17144.1 MAG: alpha/beta hydrolase [Tepidiforma sp.]
MPTFERGGLEFAYETAGDPALPAVVLLHGFTSDLRMWHPVAGEFARRYFVVAMDLRGHGRSAAPDDLDAYTAEELAADVRALFDHLELDLCALIGCSFGGMIALQFAVTWPERLAALVLSDTSAAYRHPAYDERYWQRERSIDASTEVVRKFGTAELGRRAAASVADPFLARGVRERYARLSAAGWLGCARVRKERPDLLPLLRGRLTMPVLVAIGEDDPVRSASEVMAGELPDARVVTFRGTGHGVPVLAPQAFAREVLRFFEDVEEGRPVAGQRTTG